MTKSYPGYPSTRTQKETARRKGWSEKRDGSWTPPKKFSEHDWQRIDQAAIRREYRQVGAD